MIELNSSENNQNVKIYVPISSGFASLQKRIAVTIFIAESSSNGTGTAQIDGKAKFDKIAQTTHDQNI